MFLLSFLFITSLLKILSISTKPEKINRQKEVTNLFENPIFRKPIVDKITLMIVPLFLVYRNQMRDPTHDDESHPSRFKSTTFRACHSIEFMVITFT